MAAQVFTSTEITNAQVQELSKVYTLYQNEADIWGWISKMPNDQVNASGLKVPFEVSPNPSLGQITGNNDVMPTAQAGNLDYFNVSYTGLMAGDNQTYAALLNRTANTSEDMIRFEQRSSAKQFASFLNGYVSAGDSTAGLATISANYSGGTPTIATCNGSTDSLGTTRLVTGGYYQFYDSTGATQRTGTVGAGAIQLSSKTGSACTFASAIPSDVVIGDIIVPQITTTDATGGLYGLPIIIDSSGTYYGKARASYPGLASFEYTSAGTVTAAKISETYFSTVQRGGYFTGNGDTNLIDSCWLVCNTGNLQMYYALSLNSGAVVGSPLQLNQINGKRPDGDIGMSTVNFTWFGAPIKVGNQVRGDEMYFLNPKKLRRAVLKDVGTIAPGMPAAEFLQNINGDGNYLNSRLRYLDFWGAVYSPEPFTLGKLSGITLTSPTQKVANVS